jgi:hypothetical protein
MNHGEAKLGWSDAPMAHLWVDIEGLADPADARRLAHGVRALFLACHDRGERLEAELFRALAEGLDQWAYDMEAAHQTIANAFLEQLEDLTEGDTTDAQ